jgi:hypothetical protein
MGRVARYKKVKSVDPFAKARTWTDDVGDANLRRTKKRSKTAQKLKDQKNNKLQRRLRGKEVEKKKRGGSNGWGDDDGFDLPPDGEDEFDMNDLMGSIKKQAVKSSDLFKGKNPALDFVSASKGRSSSTEAKLSQKTEKVDLRGASTATTQQKQAQNNTSQPKKNDKKNETAAKSSAITAHTPTREIIAACSNPKKQQQPGDDCKTSKQSKRKAFLEQKKLKKRKRGKYDDFEENDFGSLDKTSSAAKQQLQSSMPIATAAKSKPQSQPVAPIARSLIDDQVERPPIFSALPRGAKKKKTASAEKPDDGDGKDDRIRKEQQALEAMRERVMKQYAILRESRRR